MNIPTKSGFNCPTGFGEDQNVKFTDNRPKWRPSGENHSHDPLDQVS